MLNQVRNQRGDRRLWLSSRALVLEQRVLKTFGYPRHRCDRPRRSCALMGRFDIRSAIEAIFRARLQCTRRGIVGKSLEVEAPAWQHTLARGPLSIEHFEVGFAATYSAPTSPSSFAPHGADNRRRSGAHFQQAGLDT
jgi:hypothetical protein